MLLSFYLSKAMVKASQLLLNTSPATPHQHTPHHGEIESQLRCGFILISLRAGCNFSAISGTDAYAIKWDMHGYKHLRKLASENSEKTFVKKTPSIEYWDDNVPHDKIKAMGNYLEDASLGLNVQFPLMSSNTKGFQFRVLPIKDLPKGVKFGCAFTTLTINAPEHCQYLHNRLRDEYGVTFVRKRLPSIHAAYGSPTTKVVFNCIGLAAETLEGVQDNKCYPTRGQVLLARAPQVKTNVMRHGRDYVTYVIPRPVSNGNVILGGYMQKGVG
jgi:hypothetical protein